MNYAKAKHVAVETIPVVDIAPLIDGSDPKAVADRLHAASHELGFIYITGHGIPDTVTEQARATAFEFFRNADENKAQVIVSDRHRGWLGPDGAKMADDAEPDLKESFIWGYEDADGRALDDHPLRGANRWPRFLPEMRAHAMAYFTRSHDVAYHLMRGFALGLDLEENFFIRSVARPLSRASFVYYPAQPEDLGAARFGVGPHTDFGVLTVLCQDDVGGLQIENADGDWLHAPPVDGALVVNVGDLLARWTDGAYRSTPHRVVNTSGRERLSLVLAFDPEPETMIDPRDVFGTDHQPKEPAITCGDYLIHRFARAFAYRGDNR